MGRLRRCGAGGLKPLVILGCTGSIGSQALEVAASLDLPVVGLAAGSVSERFIGVADQYPEAALAVASATESIPARLGSRVAIGPEAVAELAGITGTTVLNAIVGAAGLRSSVEALEAGNRLALANKESLVAGGPVVMGAIQGSAELIPVDSEHAAVWQLTIDSGDSVRRIILTASGGPFRQLDSLDSVTVDDALTHPTWDMGPRITIDSATLMNKAFEVIEAHFLFGIDFEDIDVVVHPQSIVHSMVEFTDGTIEAVLGPPDMKVPIRQAITWPERVDPQPATWSPAGTTLDFEEPNRALFPGLDLGYQAGRAGGTAPAVLNAADEVAVSAFLDGRIGFSEITEVVSEALDRFDHRSISTVEDVVEADTEARQTASEVIQTRSA
ncbi:MAG: 1-deoxy-D-xylulose-5-phosphate reductoisomerase [Acidimicrobiia bacterium]|nr:1-deoxy-D-xylulose-5-phosphate reductoisomerase [Acidimicrobiia bacterium]